jgi:hypothetical protein
MKFLSSSRIKPVATFRQSAKAIPHFKTFHAHALAGSGPAA